MAGNMFVPPVARYSPPMPQSIIASPIGARKKISSSRTGNDRYPIASRVNGTILRNRASGRAR